VQNSISGSFDEVKLDAALGVFEYQYPGSIDSNIDYVQLLLRGVNAQLLILNAGRGQVRIVTREQALSGALDDLLH